MKEIILSDGSKTQVSDVDFESLSRHKWYLKKGYAVRNIGSRGKQKTIFMHRVIMSNPAGMSVDHKDQNPLNNQRSNLRICTVQQNNQNRRKYLQGSSKYKGVSWHKTEGKWQAQIRVNSKAKHLGLFKNEIDAAIAYNKIAKETQGEFACLNEVSA